MSKEKSSVKSLRQLAQKTLRKRRTGGKKKSPLLNASVSCENPRFRKKQGRASKKHTKSTSGDLRGDSDQSTKTLRHQKTAPRSPDPLGISFLKDRRSNFSLRMSSLYSERSESSSKPGVVAVDGPMNADQQVRIALKAKEKAERRKADLVFAPSVAMNVHQQRNSVKREKGKQNRVFNKVLPNFGTKILRGKSKGASEEPKIEVVKQRTAEESEFILSALKNVVLFNHLPPSTLETLAEAMEKRDFPEKYTLCKQGDFGDEMFIVLKGEVAVFNTEKGEETPEIKLGKGNVFGELGMNYGSPRERTIKTEEESVLFVLNRTIFTRIVENEYLRKNELLLEALSKVKILDRLNPEQLQRMAKYVETVNFSEGTKIIEKGTLGGTFYMIVQGTVGCHVFEKGDKSLAPAADIFGDSRSIVSVDETEVEAEIKSLMSVGGTKKKVRKRVFEFGPGEYFGERALLEADSVRKADVIAKTDVELLAINYDSFSDEIRGLVESFEENIRKQALEDTPLFDNLDREAVVKLQSALNVESFKDGEMIIEEGKVNNKLFIIRDGQVEVRKHVEEGSDSEDMELAVLREESYFGEGSLLLGQKTVASVIAKGDVTCYALSREDFEHLVNEQQIVALRKTFNERNRKIKEKQRERRNEFLKTVNLSDLKTLTVLGSGCFGLVKLVEVDKMSSFFALKILEKGTVVENKQQLNVMNEKNILLQGDHPFIVRLFRTFKDKKYLYFLMEFVQGGEMFQFLHHERSGYLDNETARFFVACVVDALDYLHMRRIIYRDLKPENLMIDLDGYAKMVDFGFAKKLGGKTFTLCGTAQYLAPEILNGRGYGKSVDYWCLGILIFELFTGTTPFKRRDRNELFRAIKHENKIRFNRRWKHADEAKDLVCKLLHKNPRKRLGSRATHNRGFREIKQHNWFESIDFEKLYFKELAPPWLPKVKNAHDYSHFEEYDEDENPLEGKYDKKAGSDSIWKDF